MTVELEVLAWGGVLLVAQLVALAVAVNRQQGVAWTTGPRDEPRTLAGAAGRLQRAFQNQQEALILFTIAVLVTVLGDGSTTLSERCAWTWLGARVLYVPAYVSGVPLVRSLVWAVAFFAALAMLVAALR